MEADLEKKEEAKGFWSKFYNFLIYGGFMVILVAGVAIMFLVTWLTGKKF